MVVPLELSCLSDLVLCWHNTNSLHPDTAHFAAADQVEAGETRTTGDNSLQPDIAHSLTAIHMEGGAKTEGRPQEEGMESKIEAQLVLDTFHLMIRGCFA